MPVCQPANWGAPVASQTSDPDRASFANTGPVHCSLSNEISTTTKTHSYLLNAQVAESDSAKIASRRSRLAAGHSAFVS